MSLLTVVLLAVALAAFPVAVSASHSGTYHWARSSNPFTVRLGDNVSATWDPNLLVAASDWSASSVLDTVVVAGGTRPRTCAPTAGRVEICSSTYGTTGWLALLQVWVSGGHLTQATIKLNDTYIGSPPYNTSTFRQYILCHHIGHALGLDDQEPPLGSCMGGSQVNEHPNAHDYEELEDIYAHLDLPFAASATRTPPAMNQIDFQGRGQWGKLIEASEDGRTAVYELDFGGGHKVLTRVVWAH
jgi:hypothetical protein